MNLLQNIFEEHLQKFQDSEWDRTGFVKKVVREYLSVLRGLRITVPAVLLSAVEDELADQVDTLLSKRMYGCLTPQEFVAREKSKKRPKVKRVG